MKSDAWTLGLGVFLVLAGAVAWLFQMRKADHVVVDLVQMYPSAVQQPASQPFSILTWKIVGETRTSVMTQQAGRIRWQTVVPEHAWWTFRVALSEDMWTRPNAGMRVVAGVAYGDSYDSLATLNLNPSLDAADRRWRPLELDLRKYAGLTVRLIFNVLPLSPASADPNGNMALIGDPRVVTR